MSRKDGEFKVGIPGRPEADYFTDDPEDAVATAREMVKEEVRAGRLVVRKR